MNLRTAKVFLIACIVLFLGVAVWIGMRNLSFFDIKTVDIECTGPISDIPEDMARFIAPYKGVNLFKAELVRLQHNISQYEGVESVEIKKYFPDRLIVRINYFPYRTRISFTEDNTRYLFLTEGNKLDEVSLQTFNLYSSLANVEIDSSYAYLLLKWGIDNGFAQMCNLAEELGRKTLHTYIKYDNNNNENFGLLTVEMDNPSAVLCIREPVTPQRLSDALDIIFREADSASGKDRYDLYSTALVKRK